MTTKPLIGNFNSVGDASWAKSDGTSIGSANATTGEWVFGQGGSTALFSNVLSIHANNTVAGPGRGIAVAFNGTNSPITLSVAQSNGFPYLGFNTNQTPATDGQTYATSNGAARIDGANGLNFRVADGGTAGNAITYVDAASSTPAGAWTFGPSSSPVSGHYFNVDGNSTSNFNVIGQTSGEIASLQIGGASIGGYGYGGIYTTWPFLNLVIPGVQQTYYWTTPSGVFNASSILSDVGTTNGVVVGTQTSDERLKSNIRPTNYGLESVLALEPIDFEIDGKQKVGFSAQRTQFIIPESVYDTNQPLENSTKLAMEYVQIIPVLTKAIQELKAELDAAKARITTLEGN